MKLSALLQGITVLETSCDLEQEIGGISYDSRQTKPGDLFVAITGFSADGHRFIPMAMDRGAAAVLCEKKPEAQIPYIVVASTRQALAQASCNWFDHPADKMKIIGVTGTNGKTTTTYLLKTILEQCLQTKVGLIGTIQNMIGDEVLEAEHTTPESFELQQLFADMEQAGCTHVVMEVSSHALALGRVDGVPFAVGVFTNLTRDHLDFHKTMEDYRKAKAMLFSRCDVGILNLDDPSAEKMRADGTCRWLSYSAEKDEADLVAKNIKLKSDRIEMEAVIGNDIARLELGIPGKFSVYNALAAAGAAISLGVSLRDIAKAMKQARGVKGRAEVVPTPGEPYTVLIDYSHTPDSLENILQTVRGFCSGRILVVFGCGGDRDATKRPIMGKIAVDNADVAIVTSDNPRTEDPDAIIADIVAGIGQTKTPHVVIANRREAIVWALEHAKQDDVIVLAGKGHETYQILGTEVTHLDEREEVAKYIKAKQER